MLTNDPAGTSGRAMIPGMHMEVSIGDQGQDQGTQACQSVGDHPQSQELENPSSRTAAGNSGYVG